MSNLNFNIDMRDRLMHTPRRLSNDARWPQVSGDMKLLIGHQIFDVTWDQINPIINQIWEQLHNQVDN